MLSLLNLRNSSNPFLEMRKKNTSAHNRTVDLPALSNTQRANKEACDFQHVLVRGGRIQLKCDGTR